jgi:hypothetical protein
MIRFGMKSSSQKREHLQNGRHYPEKLTKLISSIALLSAIEKANQGASEETITIDNTDGCLLRLTPKGASPRHIDFLPTAPAQRGDIFPLSPEHKKFIFFIHWKNGQERVDLDSSFVGYGENYSLTDQLCSYSVITGFRKTIIHSGDITNAPAPKGATEYITFNINDVKSNNPDVSHIMAVVQSFTSIPFGDMGDAIIGIGYVSENPEEKGDGPDGCFVLSACRLEGKSTTNVSAIIHLSHEEGVPDSIEFVCINAHNSVQRIHSAQSCGGMLQEIARNYTIWRNSLNAPISQLEKEVINASGYNEVRYIDENGDSHTFLRIESELSIDFYNRLKEFIFQK